MLNKLPRDILLQDIFILLDSKSLITLSVVSRYFNLLVNDQHIWKRLCFQEFNISQDNAFRNKGWKQLYIALLLDTKVFCWGENFDDRLGLTPRQTPNTFQLHIRNPRARFGSNVTTPQEVVFLQDKGIIDITSGGWSFHALDRFGSVWMWGTMQQDISPRMSAGTRRLIQPTKLQETNETQPKILFSSISAGRSHVIGLARDGSVWHWSNHIMLQRVSFQLTQGREKVVQVVANWGYSTVLTDAGSLYIVPRPDHIIPSQVNTEPQPTHIVTPKVALDQLLVSQQQQKGDKVVQIAGLDRCTIALTKQGQVLKIKTDDANALSTNPTQHVTQLVNFSATAATHENNDRDGLMKRFITGTFNNFAVYTRDGQVLLGKVDATSDTQPLILPDLQNQDISKVSFGDYHCGAVTNKGKLFTWGNYSSGALGQGSDVTESPQPTPKMVVETLDNMFVFAIGFGGWQSSVLAIPAYHHTNLDQEDEEEVVESMAEAAKGDDDGSGNFVKVSE